jgi:ribosomal protein S6
MRYEICYLIGESQEANLDKIKDRVKKIISEEGTLLDLEVTEKRKMAYKVQKDIRGIFVAQQFEITVDEDSEEKKDSISAITKKLNLDPDILRFMIIKADDVPELKQRDAKEMRKIFEKPKFTKSANQEIKKPMPPKAKDEKTKNKEDENIDKKLDEILNI